MRQALCLLALVLSVSAFTMMGEVISDPLPCIQQKCPNQWAACEKDPKCKPALDDCHRKCGTKQTCWELCLGGKGSQAAIDTAKCAHANGCDKQTLPMLFNNPQDCIEKYCKKEEELCKNDRRCIATLEFCDDRCNTTVACWKQCLERAKNPNATHYIGCIFQHNCTNAVQIAEKAISLFNPQDCIREHCPDQARTCSKDPNCIAVLRSCENDCKDNQTCWSTCIAKKGNEPASVFWKCIVDNDCLNKVEEPTIETALAVFHSPEDCIKQNCPNEATQCALDANCVVALNTCGEQCQDNVTCWTACLSKSGNQPAVNFWSCVLKYDCLNKVTAKVESALAVFNSPEDCIKQNCPTEATQCALDANCVVALNTCGEQCQDNITCWTSCLGKSGNQPAVNFWNCVLKYDCLNKVTVVATINDPEQCMKEKCPNEFNKCESDKDCPKVIQECQKKCGTKQSCWEFCLGGKHNQHAIDLVKCAHANGCDKQQTSTAEVENALAAFHSPEECIKENCLAEANLCAFDPNCVIILNSCGEQCQDNITCWNICLNKSGNQIPINFFNCVIKYDCINKVTVVAPIADPEQCMKEKCPNEYNKCQSDKDCPKVIQECQKKCGTKQSCWEFCLGGKHNQHAIDLVKCAHANGCDKQQFEEEQLHPFVSCMKRSCMNSQLECLYQKECSAALHACARKGRYSYNQDCIFEKTKKIDSLKRWYECAGDHFCI